MRQSDPAGPASRRAPSSSNSDGRGPHPGARASCPHALPLRDAQLPCDAAPGQPARPLEQQERWKEVPTRERGRPARMLCRCVTLSFPAMPHPASQRAPSSSKSDGRRTHPGARASRPHALPLRDAQFPAMRHPASRRKRDGLGRSRVPAPLPVDPSGADSRGCARTCAGGTPAFPGGHPAGLPGI